MAVSVIDGVVREFLEAQPIAVMGTLRPDGRLRQSVIYFLLDGDRLLVSTESRRAKARDVERSGWASICVSGHAPPFPSVTVEGRATLRRQDIAEDTARIFALIGGAEPPADLTDELLASIDRVIVELAVDRVYGPSHLERS